MSLDPITAGIDLVKEGIKRIWPTPMSEAEEKQLDSTLKSNFRQFVLKYEGSAADYKGVPIVGPIILLFRGLVRPLVTVVVVYLDYEVILGQGYTDLQMELLKAMTMLVLFFWFGERAVKNTGLLDAISRMFKKDKNE